MLSRPSNQTRRSLVGTSGARALTTAVSALLGVALVGSGAQVHAGDLLRGGASAGSRSGPPASTAVNQPAALKASAQARDALARTTQAMQSVKTMQEGARAAALRGGNGLGLSTAGVRLPAVPNGLVVGGLQVAPGVPANLKSPLATENPGLWTGAQLPTQTTRDGKTNVVVQQTQQQAVLNWQTFNIGKQTSLRFDQSRGGNNQSQWIAFNKVKDPTGVPSQILGSISAPGQVYVINQNGIIFGGSSQVNVHGLVASSLPINDNLLQRGLLNNPDSQFLFSALEIPALASGATMPKFTPEAPSTPDGRVGDVVVQAGARLSAPTTPAKVGGRIALVGANVENAGTITTPDGQTILAAGLQVGFTPHASSDASLRGLDVHIGRVAAPAVEGQPAPLLYAGTATNAGYIDAPRADITLAGRRVNQLGVIESSTSVSLNGRVDLLASYNTSTVVLLGKARFAAGTTGVVTLGEKSAISILPEYESAETVAGTTLPLASQVNLRGRTIHLGADSQLLAPSAQVTLQAGTWLPLNGETAFTYSTGQIYFEPGANISVAGSADIAAAMSQNILSLQLRGAELADSPVQRESILRGLSLNIDLRRSGTYNGYAWIGTPLGDVSGYAALVERTAGQLTTAGGQVELRAGGSVVMQRQSQIDVSGGWTNFAGGLVKTSRVLSDGVLYDIAAATPDRIYQGIYTGTSTFTSPKWGVTRTFTNPLGLSGEHFEAGYLQGGNGGAINITAPSVALDGTLLGRTVAGDRQRGSQPAASQLALTFQAQDATNPIHPAFSPTPPRLVFSGGSLQAVAPFTVNADGDAPALRADRLAEVLLAPTLLAESGFGVLKIDNSDGSIEVPARVKLRTAPGGSITLAGANIDIAGAVTAPGGALNFTTYNISPSIYEQLRVTPGAQTPAANLEGGRFVLETTGVLSTAGLVIDDRALSANELLQPLVTNGGSVSVRTYSADLAAGSLIDVSGGVAVSVRGAVSYGQGGSISILTGQDANIASVLGGTLSLGSTLHGFSGARGGSLTLQASAVQVGGAATAASTLHLAPSFFNQGGFTNFKLIGLGQPLGGGAVLPGLVIAGGTQIEPHAESLLALPHADGGGLEMVRLRNPEVALRTPVSLAFQAAGVRDPFTGLVAVRGDLVLDSGASIRTEPLASVSFAGDTVQILGSVVAPGGTITVSGGKDSTRLFVNQSQALATVQLGAQSRLSTAGTVVFTPDAFGRHTGSVLGGGSITVTGNLLAAAGATLDVSGTSGTLDLAPTLAAQTLAVNGLVQGAPLVSASSGLTSPRAALRTVSTVVDSNAGTITLAGGQLLLSRATLRGEAGGRTALGGTLEVSSGRFYPLEGGAQPSPLDVTLDVAEDRGALPSLALGAGAAIGQSLATTGGGTLAGHGYFAVQDFTQGGFDALALRGTVQFHGPVHVEARRELLVADAGVLYADGATLLSAPHVILGTAFQPPLAPTQMQSPFLSGGQPLFIPPTHGAGQLTVRGDLIDVGHLTLQNIGRASLVAEGGDVRGDGSLEIAGDLYLRAGQIYPPTGVTFTIAAADYQLGEVTHRGSVTIAGSGTPQLPLSAGGTLRVYASRILQGGTLRAPLGTIQLGWDGTGTAPIDPVTGQAYAVAQKVTLARGSVTSVSLVDPRTGEAALVPYGLNLNGVSWIAPNGIDITAGGLPGKQITIAGVRVRQQAGSTIDLQGGGDLYAYRWAPGIGGSRDVLANSTGFAVLPGYASTFAPYAPFNPQPLTGDLGGDPGYVQSSLRAGDRVYLGASEGLAAGYYTLLPARYALLPGAFLVTPQSAAPISTITQTDGSTLVPGFRYNALNGGRTLPGLMSTFEVASAEVVRTRSEYADSFANQFLREGALKNEVAVPRLPVDAGHLVLQATQAMILHGTVRAQGGAEGRGGLVDLASTSDILIGRPGAVGGAGTLVLDATRLNTFGMESLLIGGRRELGAHGSIVTVTTGDITVDNAGSPLVAPDVILVAREQVNLEPGAQIIATGTLAAADPLLLGNATVPGSGDGVLLRVSSDPFAQVTRAGVSNSAIPSLHIGAGAQILGGSLILDSTAATFIDSTAQLRGEAVSLRSGRISVEFDQPGALQPEAGLVLAGDLRQGLQGAQRLSLLSYSTLDFYGSGSFTFAGELALRAVEIRGFANSGSEPLQLNARVITLDNPANGTRPGSVTPLGGTLALNAHRIVVGKNQVQVDQYATLELNAARGLRVQGSGGLATQGNLTATTPSITAARAATQSIVAGGQLILQAPVEQPRQLATSGLGANLTLQGASVVASSDIALPSGSLTLRATAGDLTVDGRLDAGGTAQRLYDLVRYTDGGTVRLQADAGSVLLGAQSVIRVAAAEAGGSAGTLAISTPKGTFDLGGKLQAQGGVGGQGGSFILDVSALPSAGALNERLAAGSFTQSQSIRVRTGDVLIDGTAATQHYALSADLGNMTVSGQIDASGRTGGTIDLAAGGTLRLVSGAQLLATGDDFSPAGQGGAISLATRGLGGGVVDLQSGSTIDLSVATQTAESASLGQFSGTLHLRAPQTSSGSDLQIAALGSSILGASSITAEGFKVYDLTSSGGALTAAVKNNIFANGTTFGGNSAAITDRLLAGQPSLAANFSVLTGAEIINTKGDLTLGATNSAYSADWDFSTFRFGPKNAPGVLTLRAAGNIVLYNSLSDGFTSSAYTAGLLDQNLALSAHAQAWSYHLTAGADLTAADVHQVLAPASLLAGKGSLLLGKNAGTASATPAGPNATTAAVIGNRYQVIRTGSGDIEIHTGADVQLLNQFATIYTAGTKVQDATLGGTFDLPILDAAGGESALGAVQQPSGSPVQYASAGGNVTIKAQGDIAHYTRNTAGQLIADSERQLPMNWLYRRGFVDPVTGQFGTARFGDVASTTWWIDYTNFFEGVGTLGGGDLTLIAGRNIANVDGVVATNARMPKGTPDGAKLLELGGGNLLVQAGRDIDGGVYYVERGEGKLSAGGSIHTNETRSPSLGTLQFPTDVLAPETWLPTTLFLGKGSFDVSARGDLLLGPVANPFLLPGGYNNTYWYKTYYSTYAPTSEVRVASLAGDVTLRTGATLPTSGEGAAAPLLQLWLQRELLLTSASKSASYYQPWLRLNETSVAPFATVAGLLPATLRATAFSGSLQVQGDLSLAPAPHGTLELAAAGALSGLQPTGTSFLNGVSTTVWGAGTINVSDADPANVPGISSPFAYQTLVGTAGGAARVTTLEQLDFINALFAESGSTEGAYAVSQTQQALHAAGLLHAGDADPLRLYAGAGNISGLTLFSPKRAQIFAGRDISDIALYVQNVDADDVSVVSAGRDLVAYSANSPLRVAARATGNALNFDSPTLAGDIQISGPGTLEVLAGRNLDLGVGPNNPDGTGLGITSIGNGRNPALPFEGASIIAAAGVGSPATLATGAADVSGFLQQIITPETLALYLPELAGEGKIQTAAEFDRLALERQASVAVDLFFRILRDAGRNYATAGNYDAGFAAIDALFPSSGRAGDISLTSREIKTRNGGDISLLAPGGKLTIGFDAGGNQPLDQGILTEAGGNISIFTKGNVDVGTSRIFTLRGGNEIIWSSEGDIGAGAASKTVQSAPPTRVLIDPQSGDVKTDLAGLATGGGIGVLATVGNVPPGDVDLIAPGGTVDAGDAGIRVSGNLNIAAVQVLNADNIQAAGTSTGTPSTAPASAPSFSSLSTTSSAAAAGTVAADQANSQAARTQATSTEELPSIISVSVVSFGEDEQAEE